MPKTLFAETQISIIIMIMILLCYHYYLYEFSHRKKCPVEKSFQSALCFWYVISFNLHHPR